MLRANGAADAARSRLTMHAPYAAIYVFQDRLGRRRLG